MPATKTTIQKGAQWKRNPPLYMRIDAGIRRHVRILFENGIETCESCEGGKGHAFPEPTVCFFGGHGEGFRALGIALEHGLKVFELRRIYQILDGEPNGPYWAMTFVL
jgi:hypothetical protein